MATGSGGGSWGVLVVLRCGGARGVGGAWAYADTWTMRQSGSCSEKCEFLKICAGQCLNHFRSVARY